MVRAGCCFPPAVLENPDLGFGSGWWWWSVVICPQICNWFTPLVFDLAVVRAPLPWVFSRVAPKHLSRKP